VSSYEVRFAPAAERQFSKLPRTDQARLTVVIDKLHGNPRPQGVEKLSGEEDLWRIRVGDFRVIYEITDRVLLILIVKIGHRREVYRR